MSNSIIVSELPDSYKPWILTQNKTTIIIHLVSVFLKSLAHLAQNEVDILVKWHIPATVNLRELVFCPFALRNTKLAHTKMNFCRRICSHRRIITWSELCARCRVVQFWNTRHASVNMWEVLSPGLGGLGCLYLHFPLFPSMSMHYPCNKKF